MGGGGRGKKRGVGSEEREQKELGEEHEVPPQRVE